MPAAADTAAHALERAGKLSLSCQEGLGLRSTPVVDDSQDAEGEADTEGHGHGVLGIGGHALEDLPGTDDG